LSLVIIAQYSNTVSMHYRLSSAEARIAELADQYRALELEAAHLGALSRIESVARIELGMREPESGQLRVLTASQEDGVHVGE
ncbi:MAG: cell division protein FtsL, partial [Bacillota bacterium]